MDTAYRGFLGVGTMFDIFQNTLFPYSLNIAYCLLLGTAYWILFPLWSLVKCRHRYAVSSLMDTAYWLLEQYLEACAAILIMKDFKAHFRGTQTEWSKLDDAFVDLLYQCFLDRYQYEEIMDPKEARKVWVRRAMERCRGTWAMVRIKCEKNSRSSNKADWMNFRPEFVNVAADWDVILESWMKLEWMRRSKVGAENRKSILGDVEGTSSYVRHTAGSKSFRAHTHEVLSTLSNYSLDGRKEQESKHEKFICLRGCTRETKEKAIGDPKKKNYYGHRITQDLEILHGHGTLVDSTPVNNEAIIEAQVIARVKSRLEGVREEIRAEMRKMFEDQQKAMSSNN
ncbi:hypothetical protein Tco_0970246 [Tanacetum coccineum]